MREGATCVVCGRRTDGKPGCILHLEVCSPYVAEIIKREGGIGLTPKQLGKLEVSKEELRGLEVAVIDSAANRRKRARRPGSPPHSRVLIDLTGETFGGWVVLERAPSDPNRRGVRWLCRCECGKVTTVRASALRAGQSTRCKSCATSRAWRLRATAASAARLATA